jgi:hypothetical protein
MIFPDSFPESFPDARWKSVRHAPTRAATMTNLNVTQEQNQTDQQQVHIDPVRLVHATGPREKKV